MLSQITGCYTSKLISTNDLPAEGKYQYRIYDKVSKIRLESPSITNGKISSVKYSPKLRLGSIDGKINIYLLPDSLLKFSNDSIVVPENAIAKVQQKEYRPGATFLLIAPVLLFSAGLLIYSLILAGEAFTESAE